VLGGGRDAAVTGRLEARLYVVAGILACQSSGFQPLGIKAFSLQAPRGRTDRAANLGSVFA
jgi:hypothetical protein